MAKSKESQYDVVIVGGGPSGSLMGALLKKYNPERSILILEKDKFPRDQGDSIILPQVGAVLQEAGVWEKLDEANFPLLAGFTYRWGATNQPWNYELVPQNLYRVDSRPGRFTGVRRALGFLVDRAKYDLILLENAENAGCEVRQETSVEAVKKKGSTVTSLTLSSGESVSAKYYVDCSGKSGVIRSAMGVATENPTSLENTAVWDYYTDAEWPVEYENGGTRAQVYSVGFGWLWLHPISQRRTSVGLVVPNSYLKSSKKNLDQLYTAALMAAPQASELLSKAKRDGTLHQASDFTYVSNSLAGENWFTCGAASGGVDPIQPTGMTLASSAAHHLASVLNELLSGKAEDEDWLKASYSELYRLRYTGHAKFAEMLYRINEAMPELDKERERIAGETGLSTDPAEIVAWLAEVGMSNEVLDDVGLAGHQLGAIKQILQLVTGKESPWSIADFNEYRLRLNGAETVMTPHPQQGRILPVRTYVRDGRRLPSVGIAKVLIQTLQLHPRADQFIGVLNQAFLRDRHLKNPMEGVYRALSILEAMLLQGWVVGKMDKKRRTIEIKTNDETDLIHWNKEEETAGV